MKNQSLLPLSALMLAAMLLLYFPVTQAQRTPASLNRAEYIEVEPNVKLHATDLGEGKHFPRQAR